jgi:methionyl-tRNA formyltransferase
VALRIAIFGQAAFGRDCLERLLEEGHEIAGVFIPPDEGRPDPLGARAEELGLPVVRRRYFRRKDGEAIPAALASYRELGADLNLLAFVNVFIPREILDAPKHRSLCFHPSLLPKYRGGAAINWQVILGETESGVSVFVPDEGVDTGPIVVQKGGVRIEPDDTTGTLYFRKLYPLGVEAVVEAVRGVADGTARPVAQDESAATFQGLVDDTVARIDLGRSAEEIDRLVRGCDPQPGAFVRIRGERVRLYDAHLEAASDAPPGTIVAVDDGGLGLALRGGTLRAGRVRADAGKEAARQYAERAGVAPGERVESG